jgi:signal transduction histidine kinase
VTKPGRFTVGSWSTFGQTALLIFAALFVAQFFAFFLMRNVIDQWQSSYVVQPTIGRFAEVAQQMRSVPAGQRNQVLYATSKMGEQFWLVRDVRFASFGRQALLEADLAEALKKRAVPFSAVIAFRRGGNKVFHAFPGDEHRPPGVMPRPDGDGEMGGDPPEPGLSLTGPASPTLGGSPLDPGQPRMNSGFRVLQQGPDGPPAGQMNDEIRLAALLANGDWLVGRFMVLKPAPAFLNPLFISQIALFLMLLAASLFWASRISRPLRILARAAEVLRPQEKFNPIAVNGPADVRVAISSFNTMAQRVHDLLAEKDHMLSAIGHDLRTPLASLRIRAETIEPEADRERFIESIDEMTTMVEEILGLARLGHSNEPRQLVDLSALADSVVEEFRGLGKDVTFVEAPRTPIEMQVGPVRRLTRNLIDNAVKYGQKAQVSVLETASTIGLCVDDEGPGIPPERLSEVLQPFTRLEQSRSRRTGGIGLGLSIAHAIAHSQGAELILQNRATGGLRAIVQWPRSPAKV